MSFALFCWACEHPGHNNLCLTPVVSYSTDFQPLRQCGCAISATNQVKLEKLNAEDTDMQQFVKYVLARFELIIEEDLP